MKMKFDEKKNMHCKRESFPRNGSKRKQLNRWERRTFKRGNFLHALKVITFGNHHFWVDSLLEAMALAFMDLVPGPLRGATLRLSKRNMMLFK